MTNPCTCKAEHWQPHAEGCPAKVERMTKKDVLDSPLDVGLMVIEIERLRAALRILTNGFRYPTEVCNIARGALAQSASEPTPQLTPVEQLLVEWWSTDMDHAELFNRVVRLSPALADAMNSLPEKPE
jgi:hypothetical protein